jgi:hypothetical protein
MPTFLRCMPEDLPKPFQEFAYTEPREVRDRLLIVKLGNGVTPENIVGRTLHDPKECVHCGVGLGRITIEDVAGNLHAAHRGGRDGCIAARTSGLEDAVYNLANNMPSIDSEDMRHLVEAISEFTSSIDALTKQMKRQARRAEQGWTFDIAGDSRVDVSPRDSAVKYWLGARGRDAIDPHIAHQLRKMALMHQDRTVHELIDIAVSRMQAGDSDSRVFKYLSGVLRNREKSHEQTNAD